MMPRNLHPFEEMLDLASGGSSAMLPPPVPSRETRDTPLPWGSPTPGYTPVPSQSSRAPSMASSSSQHPYRRLNSDEELSIVQLAIQHVHLRQANNLKPFHIAVLQAFHEAHGWQYKSIPRKLLDLESAWRVIIERRGSGTGTENDTDLSQAMEAWIELKLP
jgi:hypothetical protein